MIKINFKYSRTLIYIICMILFTLKLSTASVDGFVLGMIKYSDTKEPVESGIIKVFVSDKSEKVIRVLETVIIDNGSFRITNNPNLNTDGIKIMAYPNDVDNPESQFDPMVTDFKSAANSSRKKNEIVIYVERSETNESREVEKTLLLKQNFPNPFNPSTHITFDLHDQSFVTLKIYNMNGESVATLINNERLSSGMKDYVFDASGLPSGIYVYRLTAGGMSVNKKMILLK